MNPLLRIYLRLRFGAPSVINPLPYAAYFQAQLTNRLAQAATDTASLRQMHAAKMNEHADSLLAAATEAAAQIRAVPL